MGNAKSKKVQKEPDKFFERERWKEQRREEKKKKNANPLNKRAGAKQGPLPATLPGPPTPALLVAPPPPQTRSYDDDALDRMRYQLHNDSDAFLLNNILLSVQFFENYERELHQIKNNPISEREHLINEAMVRHNKHVFFADRLQECVFEHVGYQRRKGQTEPLAAPRMFVIYDNVEASEPGDTSDYSAVLDAPFYKLGIEDCKEPGFIKLKKLEVLESTLHKETELSNLKSNDSDESIYTNSEKESSDSDEYPSTTKGQHLLQKIKSKVKKPEKSINSLVPDVKINSTENTERRFSGPIKQVSLQVTQNNILNINNRPRVSKLVEETDAIIYESTQEQDQDEHQGLDENDTKPRKSILKSSRRSSAQFKLLKVLTDATGGDDTETSGYRSNTSSRQTESSETESDYGYSTITESATPKKIGLSVQSNHFQSSGVLPDECWNSIDVRAVDNWSDDDEDELNNDVGSKGSLARNLYERYYYLNSLSFMSNFVDNFIINLGSGLGLTHDSIANATTQGASIYCDSARSGTKIDYEIFPAAIAAWPNVANQWIIRERKIIQNPRTNFSYQWPTRYMVNKATGFGCLLLPVGFRPKRGLNPDLSLQWKIIFPAAERYLESCLAHSHMRCYLFTLALHKTFLENETSKIGIDASHIKNHLFWQCEDNYAKWPEDRLGESFRLFLRSFYTHFGQSRFPNYFVESCNEFKSIPKPLLLKTQRRLADVLEAPVMHVLHALDKLKYNKRDFYPTFNFYRLYEILVCKNPLRIINPNIMPVIPTTISTQQESSDSDDDNDSVNFWDTVKAHDKHYQWKKEKQRQMQERQKAQQNSRRKASLLKKEKEINSKIILPKRMETERRRLVLEFFIPHFIAMARSSERFDAIKQAIIYLEQAQRLCMLLLEEPAGDITANDFLDVIRDKLSDCQRTLVKQSGYKLPPRKESNMDRSHQPMRKHRPRFEQIINQNSPMESSGIQPFTFVDIHAENISHHEHDLGEESKL